MTALDTDAVLSDLAPASVSSAALQVDSDENMNAAAGTREGRVESSANIGDDNGAAVGDAPCTREAIS